MIQFAKDNPNKLNFGSPGVGSLGHFSGELFKSATKISFKHVPFSGSAPSVTALMGGHIDFLVTALPAISGKVASGDLRVLASFAEKRLPEIKDVPTFSEKGHPQVVMSGWFGFVAPAKTPAAIVQKLNQAVGKTIQDPGMEEMSSSGPLRSPSGRTSSSIERFHPPAATGPAPDSTLIHPPQVRPRPPHDQARRAGAAPR